MGVQEMALMLLGIGIISEQFGGGRGLQELGTGVQALVAAPLTGTGTGLASLAVGFRALAESFGDIGRGLSKLFEAIPRGPLTGIPFAPVVEGPTPLPPTPGTGLPPLIAMSGDGAASLYTGGGANVPTGYTFTPIAPSPFILQHYTVKSGLDPYGTAGWYVSNDPIQSAPAGGSSMV